MSVIYRDELNHRTNDEFSQRLAEAQEFFATKHGTNIVGRDIETVLSTTSLFEDYKEKLTEGFDANTAEDLGVLLDSTREQCLQESVAGVQPYASLTMPILVKLWARLSMKYAIPTEPVTKPAFAVAFMKPYIIDEAGVKHYLPESLDPSNENKIDVEKTRLVEAITATGGKVADYDLFTTVVDGGAATAAAKGITIDRKFTVTEINGVKTNIRLDINRRLYGEVALDGTNKEVVLGSVDLETGKFNLVSMTTAITSVKILGWLSSESHTTATNVSFDIDRRDIEIGTGEHIEANVPLELLQDVKAMYSVDGAAEVVDIMSNVSAQKVDLDIIAFLKMAYENSMNSPMNMVGNKPKFEKRFSVYPKTGYHMHPTEWLEGLKKVIDFVAQSMKNTFKSYEGYFVIVGNPIDTMLIPNVNWTFQNANDSMNGVNVTYSLGAISGAHRYNVISSDLIPAGELMMFLVPTTDKFKTFVYYPYSFNVVNNYLNTRMQNVPSIMLTRRYNMEEFMPIIGKIVISGNDGSIYDDESHWEGSYQAPATDDDTTETP